MSTINYWPRLRLNTCLDYDSVPDIKKTSEPQFNKTDCIIVEPGLGQDNYYTLIFSTVRLLKAMLFALSLFLSLFLFFV